MMLAYDLDFAVKCLMLLYERQTLDEQAMEDTHHRNDVGFNSADAPVLSPIAEAIRADQGLNQQDKRELHTRMIKYARQLMPLISDEELIKE